MNLAGRMAQLSGVGRLERADTSWVRSGSPSFAPAPGRPERLAKPLNRGAADPRTRGLARRKIGFPELGPTVEERKPDAPSVGAGELLSSNRTSPTRRPQYRQRLGGQGTPRPIRGLDFLVERSPVVIRNPRGLPIGARSNQAILPA